MEHIDFGKFVLSFYEGSVKLILLNLENFIL